MEIFRGIVGPPRDGRMRLYLTDRVNEYVEFDPRDIQAVTEVAADEELPFPVHDVTLPADSIVNGSLDEEAFDRLFEADAPSSSRQKIAALVEHEESAGQRPSLDGSHFRCCYTEVFCAR